MNEMSNLGGVLMLSVIGIVNAILEFLLIGPFARLANSIVFQTIYLTQGILDFGLYAGGGFWFGLISLAGAILFVVVLNRFHREW